MPKATCPNCGKHYETDLDPPDNDPRLIQQIFPDAEPYQREQLKLGLCSDKCFDEYVGAGRGRYTYDEKGRRFKKGVRQLYAGASMMEPELDGVLVHIHRRGWTITKANEHYPDGRLKSTGRLEGYGDDWKKYAKPGTPVVDTTKISDDRILKWAYQSPIVDPDLKGIRGAKVERDINGFTEEDLEMTRYMHPSFRAIAAIGNLSKVSVEEYCKLAREWGAEVYIYGEGNGP